MLFSLTYFLFFLTVYDPDWVVYNNVKSICVEVLWGWTAKFRGLLKHWSFALQCGTFWCQRNSLVLMWVGGMYDAVICLLWRAAHSQPIGITAHCAALHAYWKAVSACPPPNVKCHYNESLLRGIIQSYGERNSWVKELEIGPETQLYSQGKSCWDCLCRSAFSILPAAGECLEREGSRKCSEKRKYEYLKSTASLQHDNNGILKLWYLYFMYNMLALSSKEGWKE